MARSTPSRTSDAPRDAIAMLKQDHRAVDALFTEFSSADEEELSSLAERACQLLTVHAQIEEEILYPAAKEAIEDDEQRELVNEAQVEHASVKELIAKIEDMAPDDEDFRATVKVLGEYVKHHVKEEESELFPVLKKTGLDLKSMGRELLDRKFALMEEMGIEEQDSTPSRKRSSGLRRGQASRARSGRAGARKASTRGGARPMKH